MQSHLQISQLMTAIIYLTIVIGIPTLIRAFDEQLERRDDNHEPCSFFDTVNVTGDPHFANGSYLHDGLLIPAPLVGRYDYIYTDLMRRIEVEPHVRACACKLKSCINICCPWGASYSTNKSACVNNTDYEWPQPLLNLTMSNEKLQPVNIFKQFTVQSFRPCEFMFSLQPELGSFDDWKLFENGTLLRVDDMAYLSKNEFCFHPTVANDTDTVYIINPANCNYDSEYPIIKSINAYSMLFSIPFMILTIFVYLCIPELRNQHGKSLVCYLIGLIIGYSLLVMSSLRLDMYFGIWFCKTLGYVAYYFFMSAFFWLNIISFDLWHNFRGTWGIQRFQEKKRFLIYSLYAWGIPVPFLVFTWYAQEIADIAGDLKPGIGGGEFCWLDMRTWSAMIYFFGPIVLIILANSVMFILTALKIHKVKCEMARVMASEDSSRNLRSEKDKYVLFLRLFFVMGVTWSMEIISYCVGVDKGWAKILYVSDILNGIQGFLIFILFVMKKAKRVKTNWFLSRRGNNKKCQSQSSMKTTSSSLRSFSEKNANVF